MARDTEYNTQNLLGGEQQLKGYADDLNLEVINYDPDFPFGSDYVIDFRKNDSGDGAVVDESSIRLYKSPDDKAAGVEMAGIKSKEVNEKGDRITITMNDGAQLVVKAHTGLSNNASVGLDLSGVGGMKIQVGSGEGQEIHMAIPKISLDNLDLTGIDVRKEEGARRAMDQTKNALAFVSSVRSRLGAYENRLENAISNLDVTTENLTKSYSTIKDTDMADEMVDYTTLQVLVQAGTSMLSQANEQPQQALQLLQ